MSKNKSYNMKVVSSNRKQELKYVESILDLYENIDQKEKGNINKEIGQLIFRVRKKKGLTQVDLAQLSSISQSNISKIEKGTISPSINQLQLISKAINIPLSVLFFLTHNEDDVLPEQKELFKKLSPILKQLIEDFLLR